MLCTVMIIVNGIPINPQESKEDYEKNTSPKVKTKKICNIKSFPRCTKLIVIDVDKVSHDAVNAKLKIKHRKRN